MERKCFLETENDRGYIEFIGSDFLIIKDIDTKEEVNIQVDKDTANHYKQLSGGDVLFVEYDKEKCILLV